MANPLPAEQSALKGSGAAQMAKGDDGSTGTQAPSLEKLKRYFTDARDLTQQARYNALQAIDYYDSDQFIFNF